jgi:hypothetical protein
LPSVAPKQIAGHGTIEFSCPAIDDPVVFVSDADTIIERSQCPFRIIDGADLLGAPALAVYPDDSNQMAFFSLHGCATEEGPNPWSRTSRGCPPPSSGQTFTTFTSVDEGRLWKDQPYGNQGYGEMTDGIVDREGRMYASHLFSQRIGSNGAGEPLYDYFFNLYKPQNWQDINYYSKEIQNREAGNKIEHVHLALATPWTQVENLEQYNESIARAPPSEENDIGNNTIPKEQEDYSNDFVVATWHERAYDWKTTSTGKSSWIGVAWTDTSSRNEWELADVDQLIGPCRHASNPESWNGKVYVACSVDAGYTGRRGAKIGQVDIWTIDPFNGGKKEFVATAHGVRDGELKIDMNNDGMMAIASVKVPGEGPTYTTADIDIAFAWHGRHWGGVHNGGVLHQSWGGEFREARITAMEILEGPRPTLFITYMERLVGTANTNIDANNPLQSADALEYRKSVSSWEACGEGMMAILDLQVGVVRHPFEEGVVNDVTGAFDDYQDGMAAANNSAGQRVIYFAFGDHGVIQYGSIIGSGAQGQCAVPIAPLLFPPPVVAPLALTSASGVSIGLAAALAGPAMAMFGYLLVAKRRAALAAVTKSK